MPETIIENGVSLTAITHAEFINALQLIGVGIENGQSFTLMGMAGGLRSPSLRFVDGELEIGIIFDDTDGDMAWRNFVARSEERRKTEPIVVENQGP